VCECVPATVPFQVCLYMQMATNTEALCVVMAGWKGV